MALQPLSSVGKEKFSLSILINYNYYTLSGGINTPTYSKDLVAKMGHDLSTDILALPENEIKKIITFDNGYYFGLKREVLTTVTYNDGKLERCYIQLELYNASGTYVGFVFRGHCDLVSIVNNVRTVNPVYLCAAIDEESKQGYFVHVRSLAWIENRAKNPDSVVGTGSGISNSLLYTLLSNGVVYDPDPWSNGGYGDIGGGDGVLDLTSDIIGLPDLPHSFTETGFIQIFAPTLNQINNLSDYMWKGSFFDNVLKLFSDPMSIIIGLSMYPFPITTNGQQLVHAGNVLTDVHMNVPTSQYVTIDCGTLDIEHFYDAYIDYEPYTNCQIYLPYIGIQSLSMDDIMGKTIQVIYRVDLMTGVCGAYILCDGVILYTFSGECSSQIPISGQSFQSIVQSAINIATTTATAKGSGKTSKGEPIPSQKSTALASSLAGNVMSMKPDVSRSGNVSSNVGMLGPQKPYLIFSVPRTCLPKGQNKYLGYPAFMTVKLSSLKGYTEVENLWLNNMTCTEAEKKEIEELLKGGVIL